MATDKSDNPFDERLNAGKNIQKGPHKLFIEFAADTPYVNEFFSVPSDGMSPFTLAYLNRISKMKFYKQKNKFHVKN